MRTQRIPDSEESVPDVWKNVKQDSSVRKDEKRYIRQLEAQHG